MDNIQAALDAGASLGNIKDVAGVPFVVVPDDFQVVDMEHHLAAPMRATGNTNFYDEASFIHFVNETKNPDTRIYFQANPVRFRAVFNDHQAASAGGVPGWRDFSATYDAPLSVEWKLWLGASGKKMTQADFAQFIEDNAPDIVTPAPAEFVELSHTLQAKKTVNFASGIRLQDGSNQLTFEETATATAGAKGQLVIPEIFTLGIPVLEGGDRYSVQARLRYRIADAKLSIWYELVRPHKIIEDVVAVTRSRIAEATGITLLNGSI